VTLPGTVQPAEPLLPPGPQVGVVVYPGVNELELGVMLGLLLGVTLPGTVGTPDSAALTLARTRGRSPTAHREAETAKAHRG